MGDFSALSRYYLKILGMARLDPFSARTAVGVGVVLHILAAEMCGELGLEVYTVGSRIQL